MALQTERTLAEIGDRCGAFALHCSDVAGFVNQVSQRILAEQERMAELRLSVSELTLLQNEAGQAASEIDEVARHAAVLLDQSHAGTGEALRDIEALIDHVLGTGEEIEAFIEAFGHASTVSAELAQIARETRMLAINASIEAARAGNEASGFAVVASEVRRLSEGARKASARVSANIDALEARARVIAERMLADGTRARSVRKHTSDIDRTLSQLAAFVTQFAERAAAIRTTEYAMTEHVASLDTGFDRFAEASAASMTQLAEMRGQIDALESASNLMLDRIAHAGVVTRDTPFIAAARAAAEEARKTIEAALASGELSEAALFDTAYRAIEDTDPPQFLTGFVPFADAAIRPQLDRTTASDPSVVGCCLIDRKGHLPTHVTDRSQPQRRGDRRWNLEHARNRQIFMDQQTRYALDHDSDFFLFTYRQDFGDGRYRALRSVLVPLSFRGRRWGLYELGYLI